MSTLALGLLVILAVATVTFYVAGGLYAQSAWARDVCSLSRELCEQPIWAAVATAVSGVIYLFLRSREL